MTTKVIGKGRLTSTVFVAEVGESPDVPQAHGVSDTGHGKVPLGAPGAPLIHPNLAATTTTAGLRVAAISNG